MKEITALQEFIENAKTAKEHSKDGLVTYDEVIEVATELLTKEREQITEAYDSGWNNGYRKMFDGGEKYFTTTYKQPL